MSGFKGWGPRLRNSRPGLRGHGAGWAAGLQPKWHLVPLQIVRNIKYKSFLLHTIELVFRTSN